MGIKFTGFGGSTGKGCGCCGVPGLLCGSCSIPEADLTVHWTNSIFGNGSATLTYASGVWRTGCISSLNMQFLLTCTSGSPEFRAIYFTGGGCSGSSNYCSNQRSSPNQLSQTSLTCGSNFDMVLSCGTACFNLNSNGYTGFEVTYP